MRIAPLLIRFFFKRKEKGVAQVIGYDEDDVVLTEGPFVICNPHGNGWRVEVEQKGCKCPVLPDVSIYRVTERLGLHGKTNDQKLAEVVCDTLNQMVRDGEISPNGRVWVHKG